MLEFLQKVKITETTVLSTYHTTPQGVKSNKKVKEEKI